MNPAFQIDYMRSYKTIYVEPKGHLDGFSAFELLNFLHSFCQEETQVTIDTRGINEVDPFGSRAFRCHWHQMGIASHRFVFKGCKAREIASDGITVLVEDGHVCRCNGRCKVCTCKGQHGIH